MIASCYRGVWSVVDSVVCGDTPRQIVTLPILRVGPSPEEGSIARELCPALAALLRRCARFPKLPSLMDSFHPSTFPLGWIAPAEGDFVRPGRYDPPNTGANVCLRVPPA